MKRLSYKKLTIHLLALIIVSGTAGIAAYMAYASPDKESATNPSTSTPTRAIELPDKLNTITDSLTSDSEVKHYAFTAVRGQRIVITADAHAAGDWPWQIEYKLSDNWVVKRGPDTYLSQDLPVGQRVEMRVSKAPGTTLKPGTPYKILFGSAPRIANFDVAGDAEEFLYFGKSRAYRAINWQAQVMDYKGHPLSGVEVKLELNIDQNSGSNHIVSRGVSICQA